MKSAYLDNFLKEPIVGLGIKSICSKQVLLHVFIV